MGELRHLIYVPRGREHSSISAAHGVGRNHFPICYVRVMTVSID